MSSSVPAQKQDSWSSIMRHPAMSKLLVNMAFSGLSFGVYFNFVLLFLKGYLDPVGYYGDFALYYLVLNIVSSIALPVGGVLTDKIGRKTMLVFGSSTLTIGVFILPMSTVWWHLLYSAALQAVGSSFLGIAQSCVVADVTRGYGREKGYSITMSFGMVFGVLGTVALVIYSFLYEKVLPSNLYYELPLLVAAILALMATIPMFLIRVPTRTQENDSCDPITEKAKSQSLDNSNTSRKGQSYTPPSSIRRNGLVLKMIAFQGIVGFGAGFLVPVFIFYWSDIFHSDNTVILVIVLLGELAVAVGGLTAPWLAKRVKKLGGRVGTTVACQLVSIACAVYLAIVPYYRVLLPAVIAYIARQALMNMVNPLIQAMTMDHTPEAKRGRVNSLTQLAFLDPNSVGPYLSNQLVSSVQRPYGYTYSAMILVSTYITATLMLATTRKKDKQLVAQTRSFEG